MMRPSRKRMKEGEEEEEQEEEDEEDEGLIIKLLLARLVVQPTDQRTDGQTDKPSYSDAWTHLKKCVMHVEWRTDVIPDFT